MPGSVVAKVTSRGAVLKAIRECRRLGNDRFLAKYGYRRALKYCVRHEEDLYDSKAILGVAYGYQYPDEGALPNTRFSGGLATVVRQLEGLGFEVLRSPEHAQDPPPFPEGHSLRPLTRRERQAIKMAGLPISQAGDERVACYSLTHPGSTAIHRPSRLDALVRRRLARANGQRTPEGDRLARALRAAGYRDEAADLLSHSGRPRDQRGRRRHSARRRIETVPVEQSHIESTEIRYEARAATLVRAEQRLVHQLKAHLEAQGHRVVRKRIPVPGSSATLYCDLFEEGRKNLIEAKAKATRANVRMAIGQLADYGHLLRDDGLSRALLTPRRPRADLLDVLEAQGISAIWRESDGFRDNADGRFV